MIKLIILFPLIACILLLVFKSAKLNKFILLFYAFFQFINTILLYFKGVNSLLIPKDAIYGYFKIDSLNIIFLLLLSVIFLGVAVYNNSYLKSMKISKDEFTYYSVAIIFFIFSMTGTILSTNLGLSWVFIEATTLASAYLIYFNKTKHSIEAAWKYVFICSIGIALAFVGIILLSIATGSEMNSLFFNDLYLNFATINPFWLKLSFVFILIGFGTKMGLAPVHSWLPDAHSEAPSPISALLSATLLNSAFLIILRVFKLMELTHTDHYARILLLSMGLLSLFVTAVFVYNINNYKRMLAYSSIENMGIIAIGTAVGGPALYAAFLHMIGHSLIKAAFFLTAGNILKIFKTKKIREISGIIKIDKVSGWLWILCFAGIVGLPPSPLFISEFLLLKTLIGKHYYIIAAVFLILLTIILYGIAVSVINMSFGTEKKEKSCECERKIEPIKDNFLYISQIVFISFSLILGVYIPVFLNKLINNALVAMSIN